MQGANIEVRDDFPSCGSVRLLDLAGKDFSGGSPQGYRQQPCKLLSSKRRNWRPWVVSRVNLLRQRQTINPFGDGLFASLTGPTNASNVIALTSDLRHNW